MPTKILLACNTLTAIHGDIYHNHAPFFYRLGKDYGEYEFHLLFARRLSIDRFRNYAIKTAQQLSCEYLMFIDDDMKLPKDAFGKLMDGIKQGYSIIAALNYIRGYPFKLMAFRYAEVEAGARKRMEPIPEEDIKEGEIIDCAAIGTAVCLIDMSIISKIPGPWFITGPFNTEDIYFCVKAKEYIPELKIGTHCGIITGHLLEPEVISYNTAKHLRDYEESYMDASQIEMQRSGDRGVGYIRQEIEPAIEEIIERAQKVS